MATDSSDSQRNSSPQKVEIYQDEDVERTGYSTGLDRHGLAKHGDRALALIGSGRVSLTEEDVCSTSPSSLPALVMVLTAWWYPEQAHSPED